MRRITVLLLAVFAAVSVSDDRVSAAVSDDRVSATTDDAEDVLSSAPSEKFDIREFDIGIFWKDMLIALVSPSGDHVGFDCRFKLSSGAAEELKKVVSLFEDAVREEYRAAEKEAMREKETGRNAAEKAGASSASAETDQDSEQLIWKMNSVLEVSIYTDMRLIRKLIEISDSEECRDEE